jgi:hypothetical protein
MKQQHYCAHNQTTNNKNLQSTMKQQHTMCTTKNKDATPRKQKEM